MRLHLSMRLTLSMLHSMKATKHSSTMVHLLRHPVTPSRMVVLVVAEVGLKSSPENLEEDTGMALTFG